MRRRAVLLVVAAGALAAVGGAALSRAAVPGRDAPPSVAALARAELADVPAPSAIAGARDGIGRDHDVRRDVAVALAASLALTLAGAWWLGRERTARMRLPRPCTARRTRAPPRMPATVHC
jgi:hypothetical protein